MENVEQGEIGVEEAIALIESDLEDDEFTWLRGSLRMSVEDWRRFVVEHDRGMDFLWGSRTAPPELLAEVALDPRTPIVDVMGLARVRRIPAEAMARLSEHKSADVRRAVACNGKLPRHLLDRLCDDEDEEVREAALYKRGNRKA